MDRNVLVKTGDKCPVVEPRGPATGEYLRSDNRVQRA